MGRPFRSPWGSIALAAPALALRAVLAPLTAWPNDIYYWALLGWDLAAGYGPYELPGFSYPPGLASLLGLVLVPLSAVFGPENWERLPQHPLMGFPVPHPFFLLAVKLPAIMADMAVGWLLLRHSLFMAALWLYNPLVIWVSSVHGNYDSLVGLMTLLSAEMAFSGRAYLAGLACGIGAELKLAPLFTAPVLTAALAKPSLSQGNWSQGVRQSLMFALGMASSLALILPQLLEPGLQGEIQRRAADLATGGMNLSSLRLVPFSSDWTFWKDTYPYLTRVLLIAVPMIFATAVLSRGRKVLPMAIIGTMASTVAFQPTTQPQYLIWYIAPAVASGGQWSGLATLPVSAVGLMYYRALVGHALGYVAQPMSLYFGWGFAHRDIWAGLAEYSSQRGVFGGQAATDTMGILGPVAWSLLIIHLAYALWRSLTRV